MKKGTFISWKSAVNFIMVVIIQTSGIAQKKTGSPQKISGNEIAIVISGIEYDDTGFIKLRETIKQNLKVKDFNHAFSGGKAKLSMLYSGRATELWEELPQLIKQSFKITTIDNNIIELKKNEQIQTGSSKNITTATTKKEEDCINCTYYKSCNFDTTISFDGIPYKGFKTGSQKGFYDYCSSGSLMRKFFGTDKKVYTQTLLKSGEPVGASWSYPIGNGITYRHVTVAKGIAIKVGGVSYSDVMIIYNDYGTAFRNDYYAKEIGLVKSDTLDKNFDASKAVTMKGNIDQSIAGLWKHKNVLADMNLYYKFNGDGTYEYYVGSVNAANQMPKGKCYWRLKGEDLELYSGELGTVVKLLIQKRYDATSGKPTLIIQSGATESRTYFSEDGKTA